jgi:hypothetical protein
MMFKPLSFGGIKNGGTIADIALRKRGFRLVSSLAAAFPYPVSQALIHHVPTENMAFPCTNKVSPDLLLHPAFDITEGLAGALDPKIINPSSQNRIDQ